MGAKTTTKAAVGPVTECIEPPVSATRIPATMAVKRPHWGGAPDAMARAIESGKATIPTVRPAPRSARRSSGL